MTFVHEKSYQGLGIAQLIHRRRLRIFLKSFRNIHRGKTGKLADFGCSNGHIISLLKEHFFDGSNFSFFGFDHSKELLKIAENKRIDGAEFHFFNLNEINEDWADTFNIIICLETLEHVGDYKNAILNLYKSSRKNGIIIISIPNEKGVPGILKYVVRKIIRRNAYGEFFKRKSQLQYIRHLVLNRPIDTFREPGAEGWGPHLGFDWKVMEAHLNKTYIDSNRLRLRARKGSFLNFNFFYVLEKVG